MIQHVSKSGWIALPVLVVVLSVLLGVLACGLGGCDTRDTVQSGQQRHSKDSRGAEPALYSVSIRRPAGPPQVDSGLRDAHGAPILVSCATCHANRVANTDNRTADQLDEFHGHIKIQHGDLSCLSCHNPGNYETLRRADGTAIEFENVMELCAQCHGTQMRDFRHGAHGGMNGYWDLSRGGRVRNNCVDCHHPHYPQFPKMQPTFKPRDRFLTPPSHEH